MTDHNRDCARSGCRACLGYGVVVPLAGGLGYRACEGEVAEGWRVSEAMTRAATELDALPWWRLRAIRARRRLFRRLIDRYREIVREDGR